MSYEMITGICKCAMALGFITLEQLLVWADAMNCKTSIELANALHAQYVDEFTYTIEDDYEN